MFIVHLAVDEAPELTVCGIPWQDWQAPRYAKHITLLGRVPATGDLLHFCDKCRASLFITGE